MHLLMDLTNLTERNLQVVLRTVEVAACKDVLSEMELNRYVKNVSSL